MADYARRDLFDPLRRKRPDVDQARYESAGSSPGCTDRHPHQEQAWKAEDPMDSPVRYAKGSSAHLAGVPEDFSGAGGSLPGQDDTRPAARQPRAPLAFEITGGQAAGASVILSGQRYAVCGEGRVRRPGSARTRAVAGVAGRAAAGRSLLPLSVRVRVRATTARPRSRSRTARRSPGPGRSIAAMSCGRLPKRRGRPFFVPAPMGASTGKRGEARDAFDPARPCRSALARRRPTPAVAARPRRVERTARMASAAHAPRPACVRPPSDPGRCARTRGRAGPGMPALPRGASRARPLRRACRPPARR